MHRWSPLNDSSPCSAGSANGKESEKPWDPGEFRTAYALRDRGLVTIKRSVRLPTAAVRSALGQLAAEGR
ncbi:hypothetical protein U9R90_15095 [Streptomyces sp. E11-3]|uniref:hypothetical protein n=1 Tax=Streptomyces sp. E11-3 TaxID=3110112 RepID=UPI00397ED601